jgi:broad specificity phosphatase PhoE
MGRLYLVRHGETEWNAEGRLQGQTDIGLSEKGQRQAQAVARRLDGVRFHAAFSSDLSRTAETARIILAQQPDVTLNPTPQLRERHYGVFEGLTVAERQARYPDMFAASVTNDLDFAPTDGETLVQVGARMAAFVAGLRECHLEETVLIAGHGGALRATLPALLGLPLDTLWRLFLDNCSLSIVDTYPESDGVGAVLRLFNDTSHLNGVSQ